MRPWRVRALLAVIREAEATQEARAWVAELGEAPEALALLADTLLRRDPWGAVSALERAIEKRPEDAVLWGSLGRARMRAGRYVLARAAFTRSLDLGGGLDVVGNLANLLGATRDTEGAVRLFDSVASSDSEYAGRARSNRLFTMCAMDGSSDELVAAHRAWGMGMAGPANRPFFERERLRIGYLSSDFRTHSVAYFMEALLREHDRERFEIFAYGCGTPDAMTSKLESSCDVFRRLPGVGDEELAAHLRRDKLDVLVELSGHSGDNRMELLARERFATLTITYLGYPCTSGNPGIDVRIGDGLADVHNEHSTEAVWRFSPPMWRYTPPLAPPVSKRRGRPPTFGSSNALHKVTERTLRLWAAVLRGAPASRILLKSKPLADPVVAEELTRDLTRHGVDPSRVITQGWSPSVAEHLELYREVDVALDTYPYHGTTTTCEALWMGVPVVSLVGDSHRSRVALSLLSSVGHPEWATESEEAYVATAHRLLEEPEDPDTLRSRLRDSPLLDGRGFVRELESRIGQTVREWRRTRSVSGPSSDGAAR
jgi:tetratricopeptide (TPR) repeat protein